MAICLACEPRVAPPLIIAVDKKRRLRKLCIPRDHPSGFAYLAEAAKKNYPPTSFFSMTFHAMAVALPISIPPYWRLELMLYGQVRIL